MLAKQVYHIAQAIYHYYCGFDDLPLRLDLLSKICYNIANKSEFIGITE